MIRTGISCAWQLRSHTSGGLRSIWYDSNHAVASRQLGSVQRLVGSPYDLLRVVIILT